MLFVRSCGLRAVCIRSRKGVVFFDLNQYQMVFIKDVSEMIQVSLMGGGERECCPLPRDTLSSLPLQRTVLCDERWDPGHGGFHKQVYLRSTLLRSERAVSRNTACGRALDTKITNSTYSPFSIDYPFYISLTFPAQLCHG